MRTGDYLSGGVFGKFDVSAADRTGHFQAFWFLQGYGGVTMRTGNRFTEGVGGELNMSTAGGAGYFESSDKGFVAALGLHRL